MKDQLQSEKLIKETLNEAPRFEIWARISSRQPLVLNKIQQKQHLHLQRRARLKQRPLCENQVVGGDIPAVTFHFIPSLEPTLRRDEEGEKKARETCLLQAHLRFPPTDAEVGRRWAASVAFSNHFCC